MTLDESRAMTLEELRTRATISVEQAAATLGVGRSAAYLAAARGELPVLRIGRRLLVPTARLLALLGADEGA